MPFPSRLRQVGSWLDMFMIGREGGCGDVILTALSVATKAQYSDTSLGQSFRPGRLGRLTAESCLNRSGDPMFLRTVAISLLFILQNASSEVLAEANDPNDELVGMANRIGKAICSDPSPLRALLSTSFLKAVSFDHVEEHLKGLYKKHGAVERVVPVKLKDSKSGTFEFIFTKDAKCVVE